MASVFPPDVHTDGGSRSVGAVRVQVRLPGCAQGPTRAAPLGVEIKVILNISAALSAVATRNTEESFWETRPHPNLRADNSVHMIQTQMGTEQIQLI